MSRAVLCLAAALALLAGCASTPPEQKLDVDTGTIQGGVGSPQNRAKLHTELAALYYRRGAMAVALQELSAAIKADRDYAPAYGMYGVVYMHLKENRLAEDNFRHALHLAPDDPNINHNYGWFLCHSGHEEASMRYFRAAIANPLYPAPWRSYSAAGECMERLGRIKEAEGLYGSALKLAPDDAPSLLGLARIRYGQGRMVQARRLVVRFNQVAQPTPASLWLALRIERRLGQRDAEAGYAKELSRFPDSPEYQALQRGQFD